MDLDLRYLRYFLAVAEELNFTKAAERLHTVQPSLSQQIRRLETIVGSALFRREKHRIELTEAGRVFVRESRQVLDQMESAILQARRAANIESGMITIGFLPGAEMKVFPRVLPILRKLHPELEISLRSLTSPQQLDALCRREINLAFLREPIPYSEIASFVLLQDNILVVLPAKHKLAKRKKIPPQSLSGLKFIGVSRDCAPAFDGLTTSILRKVKVESVITSECVLSSLSFVESGIGFALLPDFVEHMLAPSIVAKPLDLPNQPTINLLVAYRKDDQLPALHFLVNFLQQCFLKSAPKDGH